MRASRRPRIDDQRSDLRIRMEPSAWKRSSSISFRAVACMVERCLARAFMQMSAFTGRSACNAEGSTRQSTRLPLTSAANVALSLTGLQHSSRGKVTPVSRAFFERLPYAIVVFTVFVRVGWECG